MQDTISYVRFVSPPIITIVYILLVSKTLFDGCIWRNKGINYYAPILLGENGAVRGLSLGLSVWLLVCGRYNNTLGAICATLYIKS